MEEISTVGVDLAKQIFQVHGATADGRVLFREKLSRSQFPEIYGRTSAVFGCHGGVCYGALLGARVCEHGP